MSHHNRCWGLNLNPLQEQPVLLTPKPSLQPPTMAFKSPVSWPQPFIFVNSARPSPAGERCQTTRLLRECQLFLPLCIAHISGGLPRARCYLKHQECSRGLTDKKLCPHRITLGEGGEQQTMRARSTIEKGKAGSSVSMLRKGQRGEDLCRRQPRQTEQTAVLK